MKRNCVPSVAPTIGRRAIGAAKGEAANGAGGGAGSGRSSRMPQEQGSGGEENGGRKKALAVNHFPYPAMPEL